MHIERGLVWQCHAIEWQVGAGARENSECWHCLHLHSVRVEHVVLSLKLLRAAPAHTHCGEYYANIPRIPCTIDLYMRCTQFLIMLVIIIVANLTVFVMLMMEAIAWTMSDVINTEGMFSTYVGVCNIISIVLVVITIVLLLSVFLYLLSLTIKKQKEHSNRHSTD